MLSSDLHPTHLSGLHLRGLCLHFFFGNGCRCCLLNEQATDTPSISFSLNVRSPITIPFDCMPLSLLRLIWLVLLSHSIMSVLALVSFANMVDHLAQIENVHSAFPSTTSDDSAFLLYEAITLVELDLHHLITLHVDAYWAEWVTMLLNLQGVAWDGHIPLLFNSWRILFNSWQSWSFRVVILKANIFLWFSQYSFDVLASRM
mgnify:CR=1 FL=1